MKIDLKGIAEGLRNKFWPKEEAKVLIQQTHDERMLICIDCPENSLNKETTSIREDEYCTKCGCNLGLKTRCLSCKCPIGKWGAIISKAEDEKVKEILNDSL